MPTRLGETVEAALAGMNETGLAAACKPSFSAVFGASLGEVDELTL